MTTDPAKSALCDDPIFIVGTERSGSNLLRVILDAHPAIAVPHPPHIMKYFAPVEASYGDLSRGDALRRLAADVDFLMRIHIHPWERRPDVDAVAAAAEPQDLFGVFAAIYDAHLRQEGKRRWGCKSTFMIHHADRALARYPGALFVWLVRDPRDVAASSRESVFSPYHPYLTASLWEHQQRLGLSLQAKHPDRVHLLRYEDLLAAPEAALGALCEALGEPYAPEMLRFFERPEAKFGAKLSESWTNTAQPILTNNTRKYRQKLDDHEVWMVEAVAGEVMELLGYDLEFPDPEPLELGALDRVAVRLMDEAWHWQVELRSLRKDRNHWRRWARGLWWAGLKARGRARSAGVT